MAKGSGVSNSAGRYESCSLTVAARDVNKVITTNVTDVELVVDRINELSRILYKKANYLEIQTPFILNKKLWETSGHWENYREYMYFTKIDTTALEEKSYTKVSTALP